MIAPAKRGSQRSAPEWYEAFLSVLPAVRQHARIAFRSLDPEAREECIQNAICNACTAVARLATLGKLNLAYPSVMARFAAAQTRDGRLVGGHLNCRDVGSLYCQRKKHLRVERLDHFDAEADCWLESVIEAPYIPVFDQVQFRCDFRSWLERLPRRDRKIALMLARSESTGDVARRFKVTSGRVSQLRAELAESWRQFLGEADANAV